MVSRQEKKVLILADSKAAIAEVVNISAEVKEGGGEVKIG